MNILDRSLYDFMDEFLVRCPRCGKSATVALSRDEPTKGKARLTCLACGHNDLCGLRLEKYYTPPATIIGGPVDPYFHLPLTLQTWCGSELLWAYNYRHLNYLRLFASAKLRYVGLPGKRSLANKLPKWIGLAKNRRKVLRAISKLTR